VWKIGKKADRRLVEKNMHMLISPAAKLSRKGQQLLEIEESDAEDEKALMEVEVEAEDEE